jgi:hypothetical protein
LVGQRVQDNPRASVSWLSHQFYTILVAGILKASQNYIESGQLCKWQSIPTGPHQKQRF